MARDDRQLFEGVTRRPGQAGSLIESSVLGSREQPARPRGWRRVVRALTFGALSPGPSRREQQERELLARCTVPLRDTRRVIVSSRKGGVGKTTNTLLLGHTFAAARMDRVIAIDGNPDAGTLAHRMAEASGAHIGDLLDAIESVTSYTAVRAFTSQAQTRLEVLASPDDPHASRAYNARDYLDVVAALDGHYGIVLLDTGTGIMDNVTAGLLSAADQLVLVLGPGLDEARAASLTFDWLEERGGRQLVADALAVVNLTGPTADVNMEAILEHFAGRCRGVHLIPFDPHLASGGVIDPSALASQTVDAYLRLAADAAEGFTLPSAARDRARGFTAG